LSDDAFAIFQSVDNLLKPNGVIGPESDLPLAKAIKFEDVFDLYRQCVDLALVSIEREHILDAADVVNDILFSWSHKKGEPIKVRTCTPIHYERALYDVVASMVSISASHQGFWKVVGVAAATSPRETESEQQLALSTVFTSIGIYNIDTVADDVASIHATIDHMATSLSDASDHHNPHAPVIRCLIGCNERLNSVTAVPNGSNVEHFVVCELKRHWREVIRNSDPSVMNQSAKAVLCTGDLLQGLLYECMTINKPGCNWNSSKSVKYGLELAINTCKKCLGALQLPISGTSDASIVPQGMQCDYARKASTTGWCERVHYTMCSDVDQHTFSNAVVFLNHCMALVPEIITSPDKTTIQTFSTALSHLCVNVSLCMYKVMVFMYTCSLRALLKEVGETSTAALSDPARQALKLLCSTATR
jgi:hypothetical protein